MQLKVNFLCRDSILAAPIVLDVALFLDLAKRAGMRGIQEWLSFYFKSPMHAPGLYPEHDLFIQLMKLKNTLRYLRGEDLITHLGREVLRLMDSDRLQPALFGGLLDRRPVSAAARQRRELLLLHVGDRRRHAGGRSRATEHPVCSSLLLRALLA